MTGARFEFRRNGLAVTATEERSREAARLIKTRPAQHGRASLAPASTPAFCGNLRILHVHRAPRLMGAPAQSTCVLFRGTAAHVPGAARIARFGTLTTSEQHRLLSRSGRTTNPRPHQQATGR